MPLVLAFARLSEDKDVRNTTPVALDFNTQSNNTTTVTNNIEFIKVGTISIDNEDYHEYNCLFSKKKKKHIIVQGTNIHEYEVPQSFKAIKHVNSDIIFFKTNTTNASSFISKINAIESREFFEPIAINFIDIARRVHTVVGSWFKVPNANISSQSIHGPDILHSSEFEELSQMGDISSLTVIYQYIDSQYSIVISGKGSIYLRQKIEPIDHETILLLQLFNTLII